MTSDNFLLDVKGLTKIFPVRKGFLKRVVGQVRAVDHIDFSIQEGETLGLVGESGCGKTTTGRTILRLVDPTDGEILFRSKNLAPPGQAFKEIDVATASPTLLKSLRREFQIIFQDPYATLDPRMTVERIVGEPLLAHGIVKGDAKKDRICELLLAVGLKPDHLRSYPHEFSGGQRQRIGIARALALEPRLIIADEPVSALDVSIQAQVINLLMDLQSRFHLTYLFISHDLSVVRHISNRVAVMYLGKIIELAETEELFSNLKHPYTEALMSAVPIADPDQEEVSIVLGGDVPSPADPPSGCHFHPRCPYTAGVCREEAPIFRDLGEKHLVACHLADSLDLQPVREESRLPFE